MSDRRKTSILAVAFTLIAPLLFAASTMAAPAQAVRGPSERSAGPQSSRLPVGPGGTGGAAPSAPNLSGAMIGDAGCYANSIPASSLVLERTVELPFWARFGGTSYRIGWVTNTGHFTFDRNRDSWSSQDLMQRTYAQTPLKFAPWWGMVTGSTASNGPTTT